jgi:hypothetical protein
MISARRHLLGFARALFEKELCGLYSWDDVRHHEPEKAAPADHGRRNPLGKYRECCMMSFGNFRLEVASSEECPPLGRARLYDDGNLRAEGQLDTMTWAKIGRAIKDGCNVG